jgi:hypothetical protein
MHHLVLEDEAPSELEEMTARLMAEIGAASELEARLVRRMAVAFWKGERAERIEVALFDAAPKIRPPTRGGTWEEADPLTTFDLKRFNAVRGYQAQQGRELSRCLKELRQLRRDALAECTDEPEPAPQNEPDGPTPEPVPAANDDGPRHGLAPCVAAVDDQDAQNEPEPHDPWDVLPEPTRGELDRLLAAGDDWPGLARLAATGALRPLGLGPADLTSPEALGRFLFGPASPPRSAATAPAAREPEATRLRVAC